MQQITVLGATGSIGQSTLDVIERNPERYTVFALAAQRNVERMWELIRRHRPERAVMEDAGAASELRKMASEAGVICDISSGMEALVEVAEDSQVSTVVAGIVGSAGLAPTLAAVRKGKRILLANKESLVMAGALFMDSVVQSGAELLPVDSEHNAIFQSLPHPYRGIAASGVSKILLTGSGGPFLNTPLTELQGVTVQQACAHPNWNMGKKISVDSATMMNKGLEFIEACWLFEARPDEIEIILHPQSIIHSMVQYCDGSVLAQLGQPDMRTPIAHCLAWPERIENGVAALDFAEIGQLTFAKPCHQRFPCLRLAIETMHAGGTYPAALNAANEVAVDGFLSGHIGFPQISQVVQEVLENWTSNEPGSLDEVIAADHHARILANRWLRQWQTQAIKV